MQYKILLSKEENVREVERQEQARFIRAVFDSLEVPIEFNPEEELTQQTKGKLRKDLSHFGIIIVDDSDGGIKIFANRDLIAEWYKSSYKLCTDRNKLDPEERLYKEMDVSFWSVFEEGEKNEMK